MAARNLFAVGSPREPPRPGEAGTLKDALSLAAARHGTSQPDPSIGRQPHG